MWEPSGLFPSRLRETGASFVLRQPGLVSVRRDVLVCYRRCKS